MAETNATKGRQSQSLKRFLRRFGWWGLLVLVLGFGLGLGLCFGLEYQTLCVLTTCCLALALFVLARICDSYSYLAVLAALSLAVDWGAVVGLQKPGDALCACDSAAEQPEASVAENCTRYVWTTSSGKPCHLAARCPSPPAQAAEAGKSGAMKSKADETGETRPKANETGKRSETSSNEPLVHQLCGDSARRFLEKQYDTAVEEIRNRIEDENSLFLMKFTLVGAILAALFALMKAGGSREATGNTDPGGTAGPVRGDDPAKASEHKSRYPLVPVTFDALRSNILVAAFFFAATIVSAILDVRIHYNAVFIQALGSWVGTQEALNLAHNAVHLGWEHHLDALVKHSFYPFLRLSGSLLTILMFAVCMGFFSCKASTQKGDQHRLAQMRRLRRAAGVALFLLFGLVAKSFGHNQCFATAHAVIWALVGCFSVGLSAPAGRKDRRASAGT